MFKQWRALLARKQRKAEQAEEAEPEATEAEAAEAMAAALPEAEAEGREPEARHAEPEEQLAGWAPEGRAERWSRAELRVINEVAQADESGWVPRDAAYPTAERLVARGVLRRSMFGDVPVYQTTDNFRQRAALFLHGGEAARQAQEN